MLQSPYAEGLQALEAIHERTRQDTLDRRAVPTSDEVRKFAGRLLIAIAGGYAALSTAEHVITAAGRPVVGIIESAVDRLNGIECTGETEPYVTQPFDTFDGLAQRMDPAGILNPSELSDFIQRQSGYTGPADKLPTGVTIQLVRSGDCEQ